MREEIPMSTYVGLLLGFNGGVNTYPQLDIMPPGTQVVMKLYLIVDEGGDSSLQQLPAIRYDEKPSLINLQQVVATNIGVCVPIQSIDGICFIYHGEEVEANPPPILKGLNNAYFVLYDLHFYMNNTIFSFDLQPLTSRILKFGDRELCTLTKA